MPWVIYSVLKLKGVYQQTALIWTGVLVGIAINFWVIWNNHMAAGLFAP